MAEKTPEQLAAEQSAAPAKKTPDEIVADQRAAAAKMSTDLAASIDKATAEKKILITDFAGTPGGIFAIYGVNLDQGGQLTLNGGVPDVRVRKSHVIKGELTTPGLDLKAGLVTVKIGSVSFNGTL